MNKIVEKGDFLPPPAGRAQVVLKYRVRPAGGRGQALSASARHDKSGQLD